MSEKKVIGKATRPIFIPNRESVGVKTENVTFDWYLGMSSAVKTRSIASLHEKAKEIGFSNILEASSKSENRIGISLSAFFLKDKKGCPVENLFQSSKKFESAGPFKDLMLVSPREAKTDIRLKNSGNLVSFVWDGKDFPLEPKSLFYDWLYMKTLEEIHNLKLKDELLSNKFDAFSDIEFNPRKSFSCQARTLALYVSLVKSDLIGKFIDNPIIIVKNYNLYLNVLYGKNDDRKQIDDNKKEEKENNIQLSIF